MQRFGEALHQLQAQRIAPLRVGQGDSGHRTFDPNAEHGTETTRLRCATHWGMAAGGGTKAVLAALFANLAIAIAKFVGFAVTRSASMLAEGVHSCADTGNQALLLLGGRLSKRDPTPRHPFGYGRERYFWSFVVSIILFTLGALFAINEGIEKVRHPHELESLWVAIGILIFGIVVESLSFRTAIVESNKVRGKLSWGTFIRRSRTPELPVVLLEDLGAMFRLGVRTHRRGAGRGHRRAPLGTGWAPW